MTPEMKLKVLIGDLFIAKIAAEARADELQKQLDDLKKEPNVVPSE